MTYKLLKDGEVVNTIVGSADFVTAYSEAMGYTFEEVPEEPTVEPETAAEESPTEPTSKTLEDRIAAIERALSIAKE